MFNANDRTIFSVRDILIFLKTLLKDLPISSCNVLDACHPLPETHFKTENKRNKTSTRSRVLSLQKTCAVVYFMRWQPCACPSRAPTFLTR